MNSDHYIKTNDQLKQLFTDRPMKFDKVRALFRTFFLKTNIWIHSRRQLLVQTYSEALTSVHKLSHLWS